MAFTWNDKITTSTGTIRGDLWKRLQKMRDGQGRNIDFGVKKFKKMKEGDPSAWGKASTTVHTTAKQALAFVWLYCSNLRMKEHQKNDGNPQRSVRARHHRHRHRHRPPRPTPHPALRRAKIHAATPPTERN